MNRRNFTIMNKTLAAIAIVVLAAASFCHARHDGGLKNAKAFVGTYTFAWEENFEDYLTKMGE